MEKETTIPKSTLTKEDKEFLLKLARDNIKTFLKTKKEIIIQKESIPKQLQEPRGCFVTLTKDSKLRGCIGNIEPVKPLYQAILDNSIHASIKDSRFQPVTLEELDSIKIEISILSIPKEIAYTSLDSLKKKLKPMVDGVILENGYSSSTFLPQVWEQLPDPEDFLNNLCLKGGIPIKTIDNTSTKVLTYQAEVFHE